jgi:hypothetical protein
MIREQIVRYAVIGLLLNVALYGAYRWLTHVLMGSRDTMTFTLSITLFTLQRYWVFPDYSSRGIILQVSAIL